MKTREDYIKESIIKSVYRWTHDSIDISDNYDKWVQHLKNNGVFLSDEAIRDKAIAEMEEQKDDLDFQEFYIDFDTGEMLIDSYIEDMDIIELDGVNMIRDYIDDDIVDKFYKEFNIKKPTKQIFTSVKEAILQLTKDWTVNDVDMTDNYDDWYAFLKENGYLKTYSEIYQMDLDYLKCNKDYDYLVNGEWDVDALIKDDCDVTKINDNLFFYHRQEYIDEADIQKFFKSKKVIK